jgi:cytochrome c
MKTLALVLATVIMAVAPLTASTGDATVEALVNQAVAMWEKKGKAFTIKEINSPTGSLKKGSVYMFACDLSGRILAHSAQPELSKFDQWELQDANGKFIIQEFIKQARSEEGFGYVEYDWIRVNETTPTKKRTLVKRIPGKDVFVAAGYYLE